jgi:propanol-preferring alcohol dehydrogenase
MVIAAHRTSTIPFGQPAPGRRKTMRVWRVLEPGPIDAGGMAWQPAPIPEPADDELLVWVLACGVCRSDLHIAMGDIPVHRRQVVPGHEVVGEAVATGAAVSVPIG